MEQGQILAATLVFDTSGVSGDTLITIQPTSGLRVANENTQWRFDAPLNKQITLPVEVFAEENNRQFLHIFIEENRPTSTLSRTFAVVIDIGETARSTQQKKHQEQPLPAQTHQQPAR